MTRPAWLPPWTDLLLAGVFMILVAAEGVASGMWVEIGNEDLRINSPALYLALGLPAMAALAFMRRFSIAVAALVIVVNIAINVEGKTSTILAVAISAFAVGAYSSRPRLGLCVILGAFFIPWAILGGLVPSDVAAGLAFLGIPWAAGQFVASRDRTAGAAIERAELLEREQHALAAAAAAEERVRLARELHDVVSHSISVIAVQAQAVRRRLGPEHKRESDDLHAIESTAREAMAELRRLFGVLRNGDDRLSLAPQPGLDQLDPLIEQVRATGLNVRLDRDNDLPAQHPGLGLAAYRIVQEALTNVMKHAQAASVTVRVQRRGDSLAIEVEDDGQGLTRSTGGHGLRGIRERAELYGGTLDVGRSEAGGVRIAARLPIGASS